MAEPISITCPHCTVSIKVKNSSAFGKKVKCPKCTQPFVLQKSTSVKSANPKRKQKKAVQEDVLDSDEFEWDSEYPDDEFDDWEDDLSSTHTGKSNSQKKKKTPAKKKFSISNFSLEKFGLPPLITGCSICLILINLFLFFMQSQYLNLFFLLTCFIAFGYFLAGGLGLALEAAKENGIECMLCLILPFYNIYFSIRRFEQTKYSLSTFGLGVFLFFASYSLAFGFLSDFKLNRRQERRVVVQNLPNNVDFPDLDAHDNLRNRARNNSEPLSPNFPSPDLSRKFAKQDVEKSQKRLTKFDLSEVKPMLLTWPAADGSSGSGLEVYDKKKSNSVGTVYEAINTRNRWDESSTSPHMKFRVYLPPNMDPKSPVPCILVPPAGSNLMTGMDIDYNDREINPEHEPYVKAGFAVITFSLDGNLPRGNQSTVFQFQHAYQQFKKSKAGLVNCVYAFLETQAVIPGIDKDNVFIAGHSSAATLSLLFAEHYPQIKGCLAYAPEVDIRQRVEEDLPTLKKMIPDIEEFLKTSSPITHVKDLKCPVFLFHARGDQNTSFADSQKFASLLKAQGTDVEFVASNGSDHYQTMIDEGLPQGIEWIKKQITKSKPSSVDAKMAAVTNSTPEKMEAKNSAPEPKKDFIDITRRKVTYKITGFDEFLENAIKSNPDFWKKSAEGKLQDGLEDLVTGYSAGSVKMDLVAMNVSFEYVGSLPSDLPEKLADHFFAKSVKVAGPPLSIDIVTKTPNSPIRDSNFLTYRIRNFSRIRFNRNVAPKILEAHLRQNEHYVPDSLRINYDQKWIYIRVNGADNENPVRLTASRAFATAGIMATPQKMSLTPDDLALGSISTNSNNESSKKMTAADSSASTPPPQPELKQKYIIKFGIYSGKNLKESVKRSLKGFVWVDQKSIQVNPDAKEISFVNRSPVNMGALNRALTRNKIYQVNITQEALPKADPEPKKEEVKSGNE